MKIEHLIVQHLIKSKKTTLQDIGTFIMTNELIPGINQEQESSMAKYAVIFEANKKATKDDELISYIVEQTRKIKPLATSDLESYSILAKQFLNLGKPFPIEGLGVLQKNQAGDYIFLQGEEIHDRLDVLPGNLREHDESEISFSAKSKPKPSGIKPIFLIAGLAFLALLSIAIYLITRPNESKDSVVTPTIDTTKIVTKPLLSDTMQNKLIPAHDSLNKVKIIDSSGFRVIIKSYSNLADAKKRFAILTGLGHKVVLTTKDSLNYTIAMPFTGPLSDTTKRKDSLAKFFKIIPSIELQSY